MTLLDKLKRRVIGNILMNKRIYINNKKTSLGKLIFEDNSNIIIYPNKQVKLGSNVKNKLPMYLIKEVEDYLTDRVKRIKD